MIFIFLRKVNAYYFWIFLKLHVLRNEIKISNTNCYKMFLIKIVSEVIHSNENFLDWNLKAA